jgi:hypothetical protein
MTAEERAREAVGSRTHYPGCKSWDAIIRDVAAALAESHATGKAEGEREGRRQGIEEAALVADNFCTGRHLTREHVLAEGIATAIRNLIPEAKPHD